MQADVARQLHYFENLETRSYGYGKYRISDPSRKRRETDTNASKHSKSHGDQRLRPADANANANARDKASLWIVTQAKRMGSDAKGTKGQLWLARKSYSG